MAGVEDQELEVRDIYANLSPLDYRYYDNQVAKYLGIAAQKAQSVAESWKQRLNL